MIRTNVSFTELQLDRLKIHIDHTGLSMSEITRRAIDEYLDRQNVPGNMAQLLQKHRQQMAAYERGELEAIDLADVAS